MPRRPFRREAHEPTKATVLCLPQLLVGPVEVRELLGEELLQPSDVSLSDDLGGLHHAHTVRTPCARVVRMADEVNASFMLAGEPASHVAGWRATPPPFLDDYKRVDESYESLVYESNVTSAFMKVALFGMGKTLYRLTFTFRDADGSDPAATRVTVLGQAPEGARSTMEQWAAANAPA